MNYIRDIVRNLARNKGFSRSDYSLMSLKFTPDRLFCCHGDESLGFTSNNEISVRSTAKGLDRHRVRQNIAYLVTLNGFLMSQRQVTLKDLCGCVRLC